jgi:hypothetical protein
MLIKKTEFYQTGIVIIMSDLAIVAASLKNTLLEISKQASALGVGLQNAAPGEKVGAANNSVQYLLETSKGIAKIAEGCGEFLIASAPDKQV